MYILWSGTFISISLIFVLYLSFLTKLLVSTVWIESKPFHYIQFYSNFIFYTLPSLLKSIRVVPNLLTSFFKSDLFLHN